MSLDYMTLAWRTELPAGARLVMLALCDNANDEGNCRPSVQTLANKCGMSVRAVRGHVAAMECSSLLQRHERSGRSSYYQINLKALRAAVYKCLSARKELSEYDRGIWRSCALDDLSNGTPADSAPRQIPPATPADSADPPSRFLPTPPAESAARTIKEPLNEPLEKEKKAQAPGPATTKPAETPAKPATAKKPAAGYTETYPLPDWIDGKHWSIWRNHPKNRQASDDQKQLVIERLEKWRASGVDVALALENSAANNWQGIFQPEHNTPTNRTATRYDQRAATLAGLTSTGENHDRNERPFYADIHDLNTVDADTRFLD